MRCLQILAVLPILVATQELRWDELTFTQEWGYAACRQFKDRSPESEKKCRFEGKPSIWSVHGIWPTKEGTHGPNFCQKVKFQINELDPILTDLNQFWYEIDATKDAHHFWEHEWLKHGSCAMELEIFDTELKYFGQGLELRKKIDLYSILKSGGGIIPSPTQTYKLANIHAAFQQALGSHDAVPYVQCLKTTNRETNDVEFHMLAIEMCLDKDLGFKNCQEGKRGRKVQEMYGDQAEPCPANEPIIYSDYNFSRGSTIKKYHRMSLKPFFVKNLPLTQKYWEKLMALTRGYRN